MFGQPDASAAALELEIGRGIAHASLTEVAQLLA
jgi:hypothetical protein